MFANESSRITSNNNAGQRVKYKIIFLGDQHVGKTCIIERFMYDVFSEKTHPTVGVDFLAKTLHIDDKSIRLQLWDTAGQERFRSLIPSYLRDAACAVIVFDVTKKESFTSADKWIQEYRENRGQDATCVLVANKIDLQQQREVSEEEGKDKAKQFNMNYYEISAKNGQNVNEMFKSMAISLQPMENVSMMSGTVNYNFENNDTNMNQQKKSPPQNQEAQKIILNQNQQQIQQQNNAKNGACC